MEYRYKKSLGSENQEIFYANESEPSYSRKRQIASTLLFLGPSCDGPH